MGSGAIAASELDIAIRLLTSDALLLTQPQAEREAGGVW